MLVLASTSPRRQQLLSLLGCPFQVESAVVDERIEPDETPQQYVLRLADAKAKAVRSQISQDSLILAADTAVVSGDQILGKPEDAAHAVEMLQSLRGRVHQVITAFVVMHNEDGDSIADLCVTQVQMRNYEDDEILAYVETGDAYDKAGAYAIQHAGFDPVDSLQGCYANVVGLPVCLLTHSLEKFGMQIDPICPGVSQDGLAEECRIRL